jgi:hypothetical protein
MKKLLYLFLTVLIFGWQHINEIGKNIKNVSLTYLRGLEIAELKSLSIFSSFMLFFELYR